MWDPGITEPEESQHMKRAESVRESNPSKKKGMDRSDQITTHEEPYTTRIQTNHKIQKDHGANLQTSIRAKITAASSNDRGKEQRGRSLADWEEQYLQILRVSVPNSPSSSINPPPLPLLFSSRRIQIKQRNGFFLQGRGFRVNGSREIPDAPLCPRVPPSPSSLDAR